MSLCELPRANLLELWEAHCLNRVNPPTHHLQSRDYDLEGHYVRMWIPELKNVPADRWGPKLNAGKS